MLLAGAEQHLTGCRSDDKVPFVLAAQTAEDDRAHLACMSAGPFGEEAVKEFIATNTGVPLTVACEGLGCFTVAAAVGAVHDREVTGSEWASALNETLCAVEMRIGNLRAALLAMHHAIKFANSGDRYLAEVRFRFNPRCDMRVMLGSRPAADIRRNAKAARTQHQVCRRWSSSRAPMRKHRSASAADLRAQVARQPTFKILDAVRDRLLPRRAKRRPGVTCPAGLDLGTDRRHALDAALGAQERVGMAGTTVQTPVSQLWQGQSDVRMKRRNAGAGAHLLCRDAHTGRAGQSLQFANQGIDVSEEGFSARMWTAGEESRRLLGKHGITRIASPATDFAKGEKRQASQIVMPSGMPEIREQIVEAQLQAQGRGHGAVQHESRG